MVCVWKTGDVGGREIESFRIDISRSGVSVINCKKCFAGVYTGR